MDLLEVGINREDGDSPFVVGVVVMVVVVVIIESILRRHVRGTR